MSEIVERVARAIAKRHGDEFDAIAADKPDWTANRGHFGGRFRDVNEPYQSDYLDMAEAALEAMPGEPVAYVPLSRGHNSEGNPIWKSVIKASDMPEVAGLWADYKLKPLYAAPTPPEVQS